MSIRNRIGFTGTFVACALMSARIASGQAPGLDATQERQFEEALRAGRPVAGLDVTVATNPVQLNRAEYRVPVMLRVAPGSELAAGGSNGTRLDVLASVTDSYGTAIHNVRDQVTLDADQAKASPASP